MLSSESIISLLDNITDAVFIHRINGKILYMNNRALALYGVKKDDINGLSIVSDLSGSNAPTANIKKIWRKVAADNNGSVTTIEWEARRPSDGSLFSVMVNLNRIMLRNNRIAILAVVSDITEQKHIDNMLRESEERYRTAIEYSNDGIAIVGDSKHLFVNNRFAEMFGYKNPEEIIGRDHSATVHPIDLAKVVGYNRSRHDGKQAPEKYRFMGIKKDGSTLYAEASVANTRYKGMSVSIAYIRDVTEQVYVEKLIQMQLRLSTRLVQSVTSKDAVVHTLEELISVMEMDSGGFYYVNHLSGDFELLWHCGLGNEYTEAIATVRNGSKEMDRFWQQYRCNTVLFYDPREALFEDAAIKEGLTLIASVPVMFNNELKGIICVSSHYLKKLNMSGANATKVLQTAAAQLATVLNRFGIEHELDRSRKQLKRIMDNSLVGMFKVMIDGTLVECNGTLAKIYGYDSKEDFMRAISGYSANTYVNSEDRNIFVDKIMNEGAVTGFEKKARHKNGGTIWLRLSARLVLEDGVYYIEGMSEDITAQKTAEHALEEEVKLLDTVLDNVPDIIGIQKPDHSIVRYNHAGYKSLGMTPEEVAGRKCYELIGRKNVCDICMTEKALYSKNMEQTEKYIPELGRTMFCRSNPVLDADGNVVFVVEQLQDITDRLHAEQAILMRTEAIEASIDGIAILNSDAFFIYSNRAHASIYGYDNPNDLIGKPWQMLYSSDETRRFKKDILPVLHKNGKWWGEATGKKKDGSYFPQELSMSVLSGGGFICVVRNITQRKLREQELYDKTLLLQTLIDANPVSLFYKDRQLKYKIWNVAFERFLGRSANEIQDNTAEGLFKRKDAVKKIRSDNKVIKYRTAVVYEDTIMSGSGVNKSVTVRKMPYIACDGTFKGIVGVVQDNTVLRETEYRNKLFMENTLDGIAVVTEGIHVYVNNRFAEMFGYDNPEEIIGHGQELVIHSDNLEKVRTLMARRKRGESVINHYIVKGVKKNGDLIYVDISVTSVDYNGNVSSLAFMRDVTDRVTAQIELKNTKELYETIFENTGVGTMVIEEDSTISTVNDMFVRISGYTDKKDIENKMTWKDFFDASVVGFMELYHYARRNAGSQTGIIPPNQYTTIFVDRYSNKKNVLLNVAMVPYTGKSVASVIILSDQTGAPLPL